MESQAIAREIDGLERELANLRERVAADASSYSQLEEQITELRQRLADTQDALRVSEARLANKQAELSEAKRLERLAAYEEDLVRYREAGSRVGTAAREFLGELDAYDGEVLRLRKLRDEMREAFGRDERVQAVDRALADEDDDLDALWRSVLGAVRWRIDESQEDVTPYDEEHPGESRAARILEYFSKS